MLRITRARSGGFSLLELAAVLVVASILAAAAVLRLDASTARGALNQADELRRNLAHVQSLALGWGDSLRLTVAVDGKSYTVTCRTTQGAACALAGLGNSPKDPATGANFSVPVTDSVILAPASNSVDFDSLGRPTSGGVLIATNPARTYTLTGGSRTAQVLLRPITGFAETSY